jgi:hypothetical protein
MNTQDHMKDKNVNENIKDVKVSLSDEDRIKMLQRVVCICKGINLGRVLKGMEGCETVADVHRKVGTGSGGCRGERCTPRIKILLAKRENLR